MAQTQLIHSLQGAVLSTNDLAGVVDKPPFDAPTVSTTHSALSGVLAGFALTGLFLLIDRAKDSKPVPIHHSRAMLLLFVAFLTGALCAFLYSTIVGDPQIRGYFLFLFPSLVFALHIFTLMAGINVTFTAFEVETTVRKVTRHITYCVVVYTLLIVGNDLWTASKFFQPASQKVNLGIFLALMYWLAIAAVATSAPTHLPKLERRLSVSNYAYSIIAVSFVLSLIEGVHYTLPEANVRVHIVPLSVMFISVSTLGVWTLLLIYAEAKSTK